MVATSEELAPVARLIWYSPEEYKEFKGLQLSSRPACINILLSKSVTISPILESESALRDIEKLNCNPFKDSVSDLFEAYVETMEFELYFNTMKAQKKLNWNNQSSKVDVVGQSKENKSGGVGKGSC